VTTKHCANGESCAAYATLGGPSKLSRYNPETVCGECLLARRAARSVAEGEDTVSVATVSSPGVPKAKGSPAGDGRRNKPPKPPKHSPNGAAKREKRPAGGARAKSSPARTPTAAAPAKQITEGQRWFTVSEVARRLAVQPKTVYGWILDGELGATKFGPQTTRVRVSELERFEREGIE
jgi:excisionase family DNA binding protein